MTSPRTPLRPRPLLLALHGALGMTGLTGLLGLVGLATAQTTAPDPALVELTQPRNTVEIGIAGRDGFAAKPLEYSGITGKKPTLIADIDLAGGGAYDSADTMRWRVTGANLGLRSRALDAEFGQQGRWRIRLGHDELQRYQSDSYQTPYLGAGTNVLTLPSTWVVPVVPRVSTTAPNARGLSPAVTSSGVLVNGVLTAPTAAQANQAQALQAADLSAFHSVDLFTRRSRQEVGLDVPISERWSLTSHFAHEHKQGLKPLGAVSRFVGGDTTSILPLPIDETDNRLSLGMAYTASTWHWQVGYDGSQYTNHVKGVTWSLWATPGSNPTTATQSTSPSNLFHKLSASGSAQLADTTRITVAASRGRATQNDAYLQDTTAPYVPVGSASGKVITDAASVKLLHQASKALNLSAGYNYEQRDDRTPINWYGFYDVNNPVGAGVSPFAYLFPGLTGLGPNFNINANTPYSLRRHQLNADADYRWTQNQRLKLSVISQKSKRWCNNSWVDCANAPSDTENTLKADWSGQFSEDLSARVGVAGARRKVANYNENAFLAVTPMAGQSPSTATGALAGTTAYGTLLALGLNGWGPALGLNPAAQAGSALAFYFPLNNVLSNTLYGNSNRISELPGLRRYNQADRNRESLRAAIDWQASATLMLQAAFDVRADRYTRSVYGLQRASGQALNLDGTYTPSDNLSVNVFASHELQRTRMALNSYTANSAAGNVNGATAIDGGCFATIALRNASNKIDPCLDWKSDTRDTTTTLGTSFSVAKLVGGNLDLTGSASLSQGRTVVDVQGGNYVNNPFAGIAGNATSAIAAYYIAASALPAVELRSLQVQLQAAWRLNADSAIRLGLGQQRVKVVDWAYEGSQDGGPTQFLPTREQAPNARINSIGLSYITSFR